MFMMNNLDDGSAGLLKELDKKVRKYYFRYKKVEDIPFRYIELKYITSEAYEHFKECDFSDGYLKVEARDLSYLKSFGLENKIIGKREGLHTLWKIHRVLNKIIDLGPGKVFTEKKRALYNELSELMILDNFWI